MRTQKLTVHRMLLDGPVCATTLLAERIPRYSARIKELRDTGLNIVTRRCENPHHSHRTRQVEYVLVERGRLF